MQAIGKYIRAYPLVKENLSCCTCVQHTLEILNWQKFLIGPIEDLIESTYWAKRAHPNLGVGAKSFFRVPKLPDRGCVYNLCLDCGVERNMMVSSVGDVVKKLVSQLNICREHWYKYKWRNQMRNVDLIMSYPDLHWLLITYFGATLYLMATEKDNLSVNNHAVVCMFLSA